MPGPPASCYMRPSAFPEQPVQTLRIAALAALLAQPAAAAELQLLAPVAMKPALLDLLPTLEQASGDTFHTSFQTSPAIRRSIDAGAPFDVAITTANAADDLAAAGVILPAPRPTIAAASAMLAYRTGAPAPDGASPEALQTTLLTAPSLSMSDPALGGASSNYVIAIARTRGFADALTAKTVLTQPGQGAFPVRDGTTPLGIALTSEIAGLPNVSSTPILPGDPARTLTFAATISAHAAEPAAARRLVDGLTTPATAAFLRERGLAAD